MSSPEFFGVFLAFTLAACSVLFMIIGYELAIHREFRQMKRFLRLAGILSLSSWAVMFSVMYHCKNECWLIMSKDRPQAQQMAVRQTADMVVETDSGTSITWVRPTDGNPPVWQINRGI